METNHIYSHLNYDNIMSLEVVQIRDRNTRSEVWGFVGVVEK